jgi:hypothetical protein
MAPSPSRSAAAIWKTRPGNTWELLTKASEPARSPAGFACPTPSARIENKKASPTVKKAVLRFMFDSVIVSLHSILPVGVMRSQR